MCLNVFSFYLYVKNMVTCGFFCVKRCIYILKIFTTKPVTNSLKKISRTNFQYFLGFCFLWSSYPFCIPVFALIVAFYVFFSLFICIKDHFCLSALHLCPSSSYFWKICSILFTGKATWLNHHVLWQAIDNVIVKSPKCSPPHLKHSHSTKLSSPDWTIQDSV